MAKEKKFEGIVLKKANSPYEINKRSENWIKVINYQYTDVLITGYTMEDIKFLLIYPDGLSAGFMEFMPFDERKYFHSIKQIEYENDDYVFIKPLLCNVKHVLKLRMASFVSPHLIPGEINTLRYIKTQKPPHQ